MLFCILVYFILSSEFLASPLSYQNYLWIIHILELNNITDQLEEFKLNYYMDLTVAKQYKLTKKLNSGSFGEIYLAINLHNNR